MGTLEGERKEIEMRDRDREVFVGVGLVPTPSLIIPRVQGNHKGCPYSVLSAENSSISISSLYLTRWKGGEASQP
jgi:hypothetical protein